MTSIRLLLSFSIILRQVVFWSPSFSFPFRSPCDSCYIIALLIFSKYVTYQFPSSSLDISPQWLHLFRRHLFWKTSISLSSLLFNFQVLQPYNNTSTTNILARLSEFQIVFSITNEPLAFERLFLRSFTPPPSLRILAPRHVNSSTSSILSSSFIVILS